MSCGTGDIFVIRGGERCVWSASGEDMCMRQ